MNQNNSNYRTKNNININQSNENIKMDSKNNNSNYRTKNNLSTNYIIDNKNEVNELINKLVEELEKYNYPSEYKEELNKQAEKIRNYKIIILIIEQKII